MILRFGTRDSSVAFRRHYGFLDSKNGFVEFFFVARQLPPRSVGFFPVKFQDFLRFFFLKSENPNGHQLFF